MPERSPDKPEPSAVPPTPRLRFRLVHAFYMMALLGAALATFGAGGIVPGLVILAVWAIVFASQSRPRALAIVCLVLLSGVCCCGLLMPAVSTARSAARRVQCSNHLKNIALALLNYDDVHGALPPAYIPDKNGKPMHSWRVLILPFMEEKGLYDSYDFDEPWDGPNNRKLFSQVPDVYLCPSHSSSSRKGPVAASYFAVIGPQTVWPGAATRQVKDLQEADGMSQTLLVMETHIPDTVWTEPRDLSFEEALNSLYSTDPGRMFGHRYEDFFFDYYAGSNVALADASVRFLHHGLPRETAVALLTYDGGEKLEEEFVPSLKRTEKRLKLGNCYRLAVFVLLTLFPLPWVWISPRRTAEQKNKEDQGSDRRVKK